MADEVAAKNRHLQELEMENKRGMEAMAKMMVELEKERNAWKLSMARMQQQGTVPTTAM